MSKFQLTQFVVAMTLLAFSSQPSAAAIVGDALFDEVINLDPGVNTISDSATASCSEIGLITLCFPSQASQFSVVVGPAEQLTGLAITAASTFGGFVSGVNFNFNGVGFSFNTALNSTPLPIDFGGPLGPGEYFLTGTQTAISAPFQSPQIGTSFTLTFDVETSVVPLPSSAVLLGTALIGVWAVRRRQVSRAS